MPTIWYPIRRLAWELSRVKSSQVDLISFLSTVSYPAKYAFLEHNKKIQEQTGPDLFMKVWQDSYDNNPNPVVPVSDYGKSNIDEAFAEAFMHYVTGEDMTQDQIESFRAVLKTARVLLPDPV
jgi:hypothetical protein